MVGTVLAASLLVAVPSASAYQRSATSADNLSSFESFLQQNSNAPVSGVDPYDPRAQEWLTDYRDYAAGHPASSADMWADLDEFLTDTGQAPEKASLGTFLLKAGTAATGFTFGYQIGTDLRQLFHIGGDGSDASEPVTPGVTVYGRCGVSVLNGGRFTVTGADVPSSLPVPSLAKVLRFLPPGSSSCATQAVSAIAQAKPTGGTLPPFVVTRPAPSKVKFGSDWVTWPLGDLGYFATDPLTTSLPGCNGVQAAFPNIAGYFYGAPSAGCTGGQNERLSVIDPPRPQDGKIEPGSCSAATGDATECVTYPNSWTGKPTTKSQLDQNVKDACDRTPRTCDAVSDIIDGKGLDQVYGNVTVPDCNGLLTNPCKALLETAGFDVEIDRGTWETADVEKPADAVLETAPAPGVQVALPATVTITANPQEAGMPLVIPAPEPHETYQAYIARLQEHGLVSPQVNVLSDPETDPDYGPNEVVSVSPEPGQRYDPANPPSGEPTVTANPPTAPPVSGGGGTCNTPSVGSIDLSPLNVPVSDVFPFGIFGWVGGTMGAWVQTPTPPSWTFSLGNSIDWEVNLDWAEPAMGIVRPVMLILSALGIVWMLAAAAMKIQGPAEE